MENVGVTQLEYLGSRDFELVAIDHPDARVMDRFTKACLYVSRKLYSRVKGREISSERIAVVLATNTGPYQSVKDLHNVLLLKGQIGINPSLFPNIMLSTPLARITIALKVNGPSITLYIRGKMRQAIQYGIIQLEKGVCDGVLVLFADEGRGCFGLYLEFEKTARQRGMELRFKIN